MWFILIFLGNLFTFIKDCVLALLCLVYAEMRFVVWWLAFILPTDSPFLSEHPCQRGSITPSGGSTRKKKKLNELRAFVETKLRSCSEKALEKIGHEESRRSSISEDQVWLKFSLLLIACLDLIIELWIFADYYLPILSLRMSWKIPIHLHSLSTLSLL